MITRFIFFLIIACCFSSCEKKHGEPFVADFIIKAKSKIKNVEIVEFYNAKEKKSLYNNSEPTNEEIQGFYKYKTTATLKFPNNLGVLVKLKFEDSDVDFRIETQGGQNDGKSVDGVSSTHIILTSK